MTNTFLQIEYVDLKMTFSGSTSILVGEGFGQSSVRTVGFRLLGAYI